MTIKATKVRDRARQLIAAMDDETLIEQFAASCRLRAIWREEDEPIHSYGRPTVDFAAELLSRIEGLRAKLKTHEDVAAGLRCIRGQDHTATDTATDDYEAERGLTGRGE